MYHKLVIVYLFIFDKSSSKTKGLNKEEHTALGHKNALSLFPRLKYK